MPDKNEKVHSPILTIIGLVLFGLSFSAIFIDFKTHYFFNDPSQQAALTVLIGMFVVRDLYLLFRTTIGKPKDDVVKPGDWSGD